MHKVLHSLFYVTYFKRFNTSASFMSFHCSRYRTFCLGDPTLANMLISLAHTRVFYWCLLTRLVVYCLESNDSLAVAVFTNFYPFLKYLLLLHVLNYLEIKCVLIICYKNAFTVTGKYIYSNGG